MSLSWIVLISLARGVVALVALPAVVLLLVVGLRCPDWPNRYSQAGSVAYTPLSSVGTGWSCSAVTYTSLVLAYSGPVRPRRRRWSSAYWSSSAWAVLVLSVGRG